MDRSFLSDRAVIEASKNFVCARLLTYESAEEAPFLQQLFRTRSGELENTVFAILDPTGTKHLVRSGRGPAFAFGREAVGPTRMAEKMNELAKKYPARKKDPGPVPYVATARLGLNAAACDGLPLVVVLAKDAKARAKVDKLLKPLVWKTELAGAALFAHAKDAGSLEGIKGLAKGTVVALIKPGKFGQDGTVEAQLSKVTSASLAKLMQKSLALKRRGTPDQRAHVRQGRRAGVHWETGIPVTDPGRGGSRGGRGR